MSRKLRSLAALATVALIGAVCSNGYAADGNVASPSSAGSLPAKGSAFSPGWLPPRGSLRSKALASSPGSLPPKASRPKGSASLAGAPTHDPRMQQ